MGQYLSWCAGSGNYFVLFHHPSIAIKMIKLDERLFKLNYKKTSSFLRCSTPSTRRGTRGGMLLITPWALPSLWCAFGWLRLADRTLFQEVEIRFPSPLLAINHHHPATPLFLMSFVWTTAHLCAFSANPEHLTGVPETTMHCCCFSRY